MQLENEVGRKEILEGGKGIAAAWNNVAIDDQVEVHWVRHRSYTDEIRVRSRIGLILWAYGHEFLEVAVFLEKKWDWFKYFWVGKMSWYYTYRYENHELLNFFIDRILTNFLYFWHDEDAYEQQTEKVWRKDKIVLLTILCAWRLSGFYHYCKLGEHPVLSRLDK